MVHPEVLRFRATLACGNLALPLDRPSRSPKPEVTLLSKIWNYGELWGNRAPWNCGAFADQIQTKIAFQRLGRDYCSGDFGERKGLPSSRRGQSGVPLDRVRIDGGLRHLIDDAGVGEHRDHNVAVLGHLPGDQGRQGTLGPTVWVALQYHHPPLRTLLASISVGTGGFPSLLYPKSLDPPGTTPTVLQCWRLVARRARG